MPLTATVILQRGRYEASGPDDRFAERLPSPFRLFSALVAAAGRDGDPTQHPGLRWLETQPPPDIARPPVLDSGTVDVYLVTNSTQGSGGGSMTHPGRSNNRKHRSWVSFAGNRFSFRWSSAPDATTFASLRSLADSVTYLGRVESPVVVHLTNTEPAPDLERFECVPLGQGATEVAVPYPGSLAVLSDIFERGASSWEAARTVAYAVPAIQETQLPRPVESLITYRIDGQPVSGSCALDVSCAWRATVMSRVKQITGEHDLPASIHGHEPDVPHVAYLALPTVGHRHADGGIRGLAIALPHGLSEADRVCWAIVEL